MLKRLQGTWDTSVWEYQGGYQPFGRPALTYEFKGDRFTTVVSGKGVVRKGIVKVDPEKGSINLIVTDGQGKGTTLLGLFDLREDALRPKGEALRIALDPEGKARPPELKTGPGSTTQIWTYRPAMEESEKGLLEKAWEIVRRADRIDVFRLDPAGKEVFTGQWRHSGKNTAVGGGSRKAIIDALEGGVTKVGNKVRGRFRPGYGIRAASGGTTVEMVIDFDRGVIELSLGEQRTFIHTSDSPRKHFEMIFEV